MLLGLAVGARRSLRNPQKRNSPALLRCAACGSAADTVDVVSIDDPRVEGVTLYLSDFTRSLTAKLGSGDLFNEVRTR